MSWFKEHALEAIGLVIAALTFFGIQPSEVAIKADYLPGLLYLLAGFLMGLGICRMFCGIRFKPESEQRMSLHEFKERFDAVPYELKVFLKTVLREGAAYRRTDNYLGWNHYLEYLENFVVMQTIQNGISKYTMKEDFQELFEQNPSLLVCVSDSEVDKHAISGKEGVLPTYVDMNNHFYWWYYLDSADAPKPFSATDSAFRIGRKDLKVKNTASSCDAPGQ